MYACSSLFYITGDSKLLSVTKVVTLRDFEQNDPLPPPEKWVKCFRVTDSLHELSTSVMQEWEFPYTNHVLLHIDVPNQQLYHLPLLITPVHCIYLVTFDLREGSKALKRINEAVKHIFAFVSCSPNSMLNNYKPSKVLLVGTHEREITHDQKIQFTQELRESLKKYRDLIVKPNDAKFLAVEADCIDIQNSNIFRQIISHSCQPQVQICRCMEYRNELHQEFLRKPIVLPHVSNADQKKFLAFLHDYGFIVRRYEDLTQDDTPVVSRPQYLCELFAKALELSKRYNGEITVEDLFSSNAKLDRSVQKWFEVFCIRMGLVIEKPMGDGRHLVFVLSRQLRPKPASRIYSIDALLVTYKPRRQGIDCFIPPWFFPAFTSEFLKILHGREECKNRLAVEIDSPAHICVHWRVGCRIHVLEQESCIEIGFQLVAVNWSKCNIQANYLRKLQERCQTVQAVVDRSAEKTVEHLKSPRNVTDIAYGFYHTCGGTEVIGVHALDEFDDSSLDCCCTCEEIPCTPMQDIWFRDVTNCKVCNSKLHKCVCTST